jgi:hypothetical protein
MAVKELPQLQLLTIQEVEGRRQQLDQEAHADEVALLMGVVEKAEVIERNLYREFEQRWLEMEALLLKSSTSRYLH